MATENIRKRAQQEQEQLEKGFQVSIQELEDEKVVLEFNGKEFEYPKAQPAWVSLFIAHYGEGPQKELSDEKTLEFLHKLIGSALVKEIIEVADNNFSIADVGEQIVQPIQSYWSDPDQAQPDSKKKQNPASTSDS